VVVEAEEEEVVVEKPLLRWPLLLLRKKLRRLPLLLTCSAEVHQLLSVIECFYFRCIVN
jgi:hypothetical protein